MFKFEALQLRQDAREIGWRCSGEETCNGHPRNTERSASALTADVRTLCLANRNIFALRTANLRRGRQAAQIKVLATRLLGSTEIP